MVGAVAMLGHLISLVLYFLMAKPERSVSDASPADAGWIYLGGKWGADVALTCRKSQK